MTLRYCSVCIRALIFFRLPESAVAFRHSPLRVLFRRNKCFANHRRTRRQFHSGFGQDLKNSGKTARCLSATCLSSIIALQNFPNRFPYSGVKIQANRKVCPVPRAKGPRMPVSWIEMHLFQFFRKCTAAWLWHPNLFAMQFFNFVSVSFFYWSVTTLLHNDWGCGSLFLYTSSLLA